MSERLTAQELWIETVAFAEKSLLRMNGSATTLEVNALARKVYASVEFLTIERAAKKRKSSP